MAFVGCKGTNNDLGLCRLLFVPIDSLLLLLLLLLLKHFILDPPEILHLPVVYHPVIQSYDACETTRAYVLP